MSPMQWRHAGSSKIIATKVRIANDFFGRLLGLMFSSGLGEWDGLLLRPCSSIHTFFMRYAIDVVFLNSNNRVVRVVRNMKPWRMTRWVWKARYVVEMKAGMLPEDVVVGLQTEWVCIN